MRNRKRARAPSEESLDKEEEQQFDATIRDKNKRIAL